MRIAPEDINTALIAEDIEGHLALGAPQDEYASEARQISAILSGAPLTVDNITAAITRVWTQSFNLSEQELRPRLPAIHRVAQQLLSD